MSKIEWEQREAVTGVLQAEQDGILRDMLGAMFVAHGVARQDIPRVFEAIGALGCEVVRKRRKG